MNSTNTAPLLAFMEQYGVGIFPCNAKKEPLTAHGFKDASRDKVQMAEWMRRYPNCTWGMPTGRATGFFVVDVDIKPHLGKHGDEALAKLCLAHGALPSTAEVVTPSGGKHLYFRHPEDVETKSLSDLQQNDIGAGLDIRADGGYVIVPPSCVDGHAYEWEASSDPAEVGFAAAPPWLIELARKAPADPPPRAEPSGKSTLLRALEGIRRGSPLHDSLRDLTATLAGHSVHFDDGCALLSAVLESSSAPRDARFEERRAEIPKLMRTALEKYGRAAQPITVADARLPTDWVEAEQLPPRFIVPGLLPEAEAGSVVGPGGTCKSTMKVYESVHLILGRDLYGRGILKPGAVLAVSKEDRAELIDYRLKQICRGLGLSESEMCRVHSHFLRLVLRGDSFALQRIGLERIPFRSGDVSDLVETFQGEGIVSAWFDTASRFATGEGNEEAKVTVDAATVIADAWQCAVELLHHVSQGIARTGTVDMHAGRGGTAFVDNGRFARQVLRHTGGEALPGAVAYRVPESIDPQAETLLRMHIVKLTGARHDLHAPIWIERREEWQFVCAEGATGGRTTREDRQAEARGEQATADDAAVLGFVREQLTKHPPRRLTQNALVESRERIVRGMSAHRVRDAVGRMRLDGALIDVDLPGKVVRGQRTFLAPAGWQEVL